MEEITKLIFKEDTHEYFFNGKKLISVTQLMQKHNLSPDYSSIPSSVLNAKAERGTLIHKEIENYIKDNEIGFTNEVAQFIDYAKVNKLEIMASERITHNDVVAGTVDLVFKQFSDLIIADIKTTATLHKEAVSWQLSIYAYLLCLPLDKIKAQAFHFDKDGNLRVYYINLKPVEEIQKLMECERQGLVYMPPALKVEETQLQELADVEATIKRYELLKKDAEEQAQEMRSALMQAMEKNSVKTFENERIKITYVEATTRSSVDSTKLKKEMPEIAEKYTKTSNVKASLRITLKEEK